MGTCESLYRRRGGRPNPARRGAALPCGHGPVVDPRPGPGRRGLHAARRAAAQPRLAQHAERLGYRRFWLAEHHNMPGIASAATSVVIGHVAAGTQTIRVGAGGIMLPNHSPLVIAEQFGTLETLYPGPHRPRPRPRARHRPGDRAGAAPRPARAPSSFPEDVQELQALSRRCSRASASGPCPARALDVPLWILGSSLYGAQLAAALGLPYAFASHFAPDAMHEALARLPRSASSRPRQHASAVRDDRRQRLRRRHRRRGPAALHLGAAGLRQLLHAAAAAACSARRSTTSRRSGAPPRSAGVADAAGLRRRVAATVRTALERLLQRTGADELMVVTSVFDFEARLRSYALLAEVGQDLGSAPHPRAAAS